MNDPVSHMATPQSKASAVTCDVQVEMEAVGTVEDDVGESRDMAEVERQLEQLALELNTGQQLCSEQQVSGQSCGK